MATVIVIEDDAAYMISCNALDLQWQPYPWQTKQTKLPPAQTQSQPLFAENQAERAQL